MSPVGQLETFPALSRMSVAGGRADEIRAKADITPQGSVRRPCRSTACAAPGGGRRPSWEDVLMPKAALYTAAAIFAVISALKGRNF